MKRSTFTTRTIPHPVADSVYVVVSDRRGRDIAGGSYRRGKWLGIEVFDERDRKNNRTRIAAANAFDRFAAERRQAAFEQMGAVLSAALPGGGAQ